MMVDIARAVSPLTVSPIGATARAISTIIAVVTARVFGLIRMT
jgi:hypothetical protein